MQLSQDLNNLQNIFVQPEHPQSKTLFHSFTGDREQELCLEVLFTWLSFNQTLGADVSPVRQRSPLVNSFCSRENRCPCLDGRAGD